MSAEKIPANICEELKIINLVLELIPIELKLNRPAIALALKSRLNKVAHRIVIDDLRENGFKIVHDMVVNDSKEKEPTKLSDMSFLDIVKLVYPHPDKEAKIDMVIKCKQSHGTIKKGNYYAIKSGSWTWAAYLIEGHEGLWNADIFEKPLKVGDKFKHNNVMDVKEITAFEIADDDIRVVYLKNKYLYKTAIKNFDENLKYFTKIETAEEKEPVKPEWQPEFNVDDWIETKDGFNIGQIIEIDYKHNTYICGNRDGNARYSFNDDDIHIWQPMQKLKDQLEFSEELRVNQANAISKLFKTERELKDQLSQANQKIEELKADLPKEVKLKHKWVELSEFIKNNPEWIKDNPEVILAHADYFYRKGDLIRYTYNKMNNNFIFEYAKGIAKLMVPIHKLKSLKWV